MNLKKLTLNALFLAIGTVLGQVIPPIFFGMKPGTALVVLFIIILLNDDFKTCMASAFVIGLLSAATTSFPGGQIPNFIDKFVTTAILFFLLKPLKAKLSNQINIVIISAVGTLISGTTFLFLALITVGLPAKFPVLMSLLVLPGCIINSIVGLVLCNAVNLALKRAAIKQL